MVLLNVVNYFWIDIAMKIIARHQLVPGIATVFFLLLTLCYVSDAEEVTDAKLMLATFGGGCFWCMEPPFDKLNGVHSTTSGYIGGKIKSPTYQQVSAGASGHAEAVQIAYDPQLISYEELLEVFWRNIDPTVRNRQFCDSGSQYRSAIFFHDREQERLARQSKERLEMTKPFKAPIVTEIIGASEFYVAEDYHQDYYQKNPLRYKYYRHSCGRDQRLKELWNG